MVWFQDAVLSAWCVFFFVLLVEATHAVQSLTKSDRCVINAKRAVGATVRKLLSFGLRCTTNDVHCFMVFSAKSRLLVRIWMRAFSCFTRCQPPRSYHIGLLFFRHMTPSCEFLQVNWRKTQNHASKNVCSVCFSMCIFSVCQGVNLRHRSHICHLVIWAHCESVAFHACSQCAVLLEDRIGRLLA